MSPPSRRHLLYGLVAMGIVGWSSQGDASTLQQGDASTLQLLRRVGAAVPYATTAIRGVANGVAQLMTGGATNSAFDRPRRDRLAAFALQLREIASNQGIAIRGLEGYHSNWNPPDTEGARRYPSRSREWRLRQRATQWSQITNRLATMIREVDAALRILQREGDNLVPAGPQQQLASVLWNRADLLGHLVHSPQPTSAEAFAILGNVIGNYSELHRELRRTISLIDRFVSSLPV